MVTQDLFFQYVWNNFLHTQVERSISNVLSKTSKAEESPRPLEEQPSQSPLTPTTVTQEEDTPLVTHVSLHCTVCVNVSLSWYAVTVMVCAYQRLLGHRVVTSGLFSIAIYNLELL